MRVFENYYPGALDDDLDDEDIHWASYYDNKTDAADVMDEMYHLLHENDIDVKIEKDYATNIFVKLTGLYKNVNIVLAGLDENYYTDTVEYFFPQDEDVNEQFNLKRSTHI